MVEGQPDTLADQRGVERHADVAGHQHGDASNRSGFLLEAISWAASVSSAASAAPTALDASGKGRNALMMVCRSLR